MALLDDCARTVAGDNKLTSEEAELLRAMADGIGFGLPPYLGALERDF